MNPMQSFARTSCVFPWRGTLDLGMEISRQLTSLIGCLLPSTYKHVHRLLGVLLFSRRKADAYDRRRILAADSHQLKMVVNRRGVLFVEPTSTHQDRSDFE